MHADPHDRLAGIEPHLLWGYFERMARIPRCSKQEEAVMAWVDEVASAHGLEPRRDAAGNRVIRVPATPGREQAPVVVLQGHVDMVCEKNPEAAHDFGRDPIRPRIAGEWITADGTTLGADNGIGVAAALAFLDDRDAVHGPLELLFTVDEETGLTGARELDPRLVTGRILLNMDAEEVGRFTVGSAGGRDTRLRLPAPRQPWSDGVCYGLEIGGLLGGHSGVDIDKNRGNAIRILGRLLQAGLATPGHVELRLGSARGGSKRNAIPRQAEAVVAVPAGAREAFERAVHAAAEEVRRELLPTDRDLAIRIEPLSGDRLAAARTAGFAAPDASARVVQLINAVPSGVMAMSTAFAGLVDTSSNLGVLVDAGDGYELISSTRSARAAALEGALAQIRGAGALAGAEIEHSDGYGPWEARQGSPLLDTVKEVYRRLFAAEPSFESIHGGLECGLFAEKLPDIEMIAFGALILDAHSPSERVNIESVQRFWTFTRALVAELAGDRRPAAHR